MAISVPEVAERLSCPALSNWGLLKGNTHHGCVEELVLWVLIVPTAEEGPRKQLEQAAEGGVYTACVLARRKFPCRNTCSGEGLGDVWRFVLTSARGFTCSFRSTSSQSLCPSVSRGCPQPARGAHVLEELEVDPQVSLLPIPGLHVLLRLADLHACQVEHYHFSQHCHLT